MTNRIVIIGGGFSGCLMAHQLLHQAAHPIDVVLIEKKTQLGLGVAYATTSTFHLLNVPAQNMSAFPDQPHHFLDWLQQRKNTGAIDSGVSIQADAYLPRCLYGLYIADIMRSLQEFCQNSMHKFQNITSKAEKIVWTDNKNVSIRCANGFVCSANCVVLATGNALPRELPYNEDDLSSRIIQNPWENKRIVPIPKQNDIAIVGAGLTMIDVVISLQKRQHIGKIHVLSRHGKMPMAHHCEIFPTIDPVLDGNRSLRIAFRQVRNALKDNSLNWRQVIDSLRSVSQRQWQTWSLHEKYQFQRHVRHHWDRHRHRIAPSVAQNIKKLIQSGQLHLHAGKLLSLSKQKHLVGMSWLPRGGRLSHSKQVGTVINCTGPDQAVAANNSILMQLLSEQKIRFDGWGYQVVENYQHQLAVIGPLCKGQLYEITAVPDIRQQCVWQAKKLLQDQNL